MVELRIRGWKRSYFIKQSQKGKGIDTIDHEESSIARIVGQSELNIHHCMIIQTLLIAVSLAPKLGEPSEYSWV